MSAGTPTTAVRYDPCDVDIDNDNDPYPTWRRPRDESPLYRNDDLDFYAVSRWDDVKRAARPGHLPVRTRDSAREALDASTERPARLTR
jgi:hypothetical protein